MDRLSRRNLLTFISAGLAIEMLPSVPILAKEKSEVAPAEDLMREHGVLKRILLIYQDVEGKLRRNESFPMNAVSDSASVIKTFIESYHEKLEEQYLFPMFRKAGKLVDLVDTLELQHARGRAVTARILTIAGNSVTEPGRSALANDLHAFVRMYAPHEAREDTVLFPALHEIVSEKEYERMGDRSEDEEHERFGEHGFESMVERVAEIEKTLGIYDLAQFTPQ